MQLNCFRNLVHVLIQISQSLIDLRKGNKVFWYQSWYQQIGGLKWIGASLLNSSDNVLIGKLGLNLFLVFLYR